MLVTAASLIVIYVLAVVVVFVVVNVSLPSIVAGSLGQTAGGYAPFFSHGRPDGQAVGAYERAVSQLPGSSLAHGYEAVIDERGVVIASTGGERARPGSALAARLSRQEAAALDGVLAGHATVVQREPDAGMLAIAPIPGPGGRPTGALVWRFSAWDTNGYWISYYLVGTGYSVVTFVVVAAIIGVLFGLIVARPLLRRFAALTAAVESWSAGDFSHAVDDPSRDEIGTLTRRLNRMAGELRALVDSRQKLAVAEERNRLARDIHDSVKQQVFALSMGLSTARARLDQGRPEDARAPLVEAERLAQEAQRELASLLGHLRPVALAGRPLGMAIEEHAAAWSRRTGLAADVRVELAREPAAPVEEALFRVVQEALANVARHSGGTRARVRLASEGPLVCLTVVDDGRGIDGVSGTRLGMGLESMRERMHALGGELLVERDAGGGTAVSARCELGAP